MVVVIEGGNRAQVLVGIARKVLGVELDQVAVGVVVGSIVVGRWRFVRG